MALIKIFDELWYIKRLRKEYNYETKEYINKEEESLAYMCPVSKDSSFTKMKETGRNWSRNDINPLGNQIKNEPVEGFKIGNSVSRWTTNNKLFRVEDPRGFTLEITTGNLEMLMRDVTIKNGIICGKCLWGREGSTNILLHIESEPYKNSLKVGSTKTPKYISLSSIKKGDRVLTSTGTELLYLGKFIISGVVTKYIHNIDSNGNRIYNSVNTSEEELISARPVNLFKKEKPLMPDFLFSLENKMKIVKIINSNNNTEFDCDENVTDIDHIMIPKYEYNAITTYSSYFRMLDAEEC